MGSDEDFWVSSDAVFINNFWIRSSVCALKILASTIDLGFKDDFWVGGTQFLSMVSPKALVYMG